MADVLDLVQDLDAIVWEVETGTWKFSFVSQRAEGLVGFPLATWFSEPDFWKNRIHPEDRDKAIARSQEMIRRRRPYESEYRVIAADGRVLWFRDIVRVIDAPAGQRPRLRGVLIDVTERKSLEERWQQAWAKEREASRRLQALSETRSTILRAVSHEVRTPLSALLGSALTLERHGGDLPDAQRRELLHAVVANARKLQRLLTDLLDLERLERGQLEPQRVPTNLGALVTRLARDFDFADEHPLQVDAAPVTVAIDRGKVERIVDNLLRNADRYTPPGTPVWVCVRPEGDGALLAVDDTGPGVPRHLAREIFEPFRRNADDRNLPSGGAGIGLSLVAQFAALHGGRAWVEDRPGGGASFRVLLPGAGGPAYTERREDPDPALSDEFWGIPGLTPS